MASDARVFEALLRSDFRAFLHKTFATLSPGQTYVRTWHVEAIAWRTGRPPGMIPASVMALTKGLPSFFCWRMVSS
jgi:hypothetical protein